MATTYNLKEIALKFAKKQAIMADDILEEAPILARLKWETASHCDKMSSSYEFEKELEFKRKKDILFRKF